MKSLIPAGAIWSGYGISRTQFHMVGRAVTLGGHVRAGMEDKLYLRRGVLRRGNAARVERLGAIVESLGESVANPAEAKAILGSP